MRAMPAGGERDFAIRLMCEIRSVNRDDVDPVFAETKCGFDRFDQSRPILLR